MIVDVTESDGVDIHPRTSAYVFSSSTSNSSPTAAGPYCATRDELPCLPHGYSWMDALSRNRFFCGGPVNPMVDIVGD